MDNSNKSLFNFGLNENAKSQLQSLAQVAGIAALLSLVSAILGAASLFIGKGTTRQAVEGFGQTTIYTERSESPATTIISLLVGLLMFFFLNRFATQTKKGLAASNPEILENGFGGLAAYFTTMGVLICLVLVAFVFLLFVVLSRF